MATIANAIQITNGTANTFNSINKSINVVQKRFQLFKIEFNKSIDTKSIDEATAKFTKIAKSLNVVVDSFKELKTQSSQSIDTGSMSVAAEKMKTFNSNVQAGKGGASGFAGKVKGIASSVWPAVKAGMALSDSYARQNSNLESVNDGNQTQAELQKKVFAAAQNSRSAYDGTIATVTKLSSTAKDNFKTNDEAIYFTELMNKAFSGVDASSATDGIDKITEAMASGKMEGNDFASVMEKAPMLAQAVSKYTGKPVNQVMAGDGVSADVLKNSLYSAADDINTKFLSIPATFEQLGTRVKDTVIQAVGPILQVLSDGATWMNNNWSTIEPIFWGLAAAVAVFAIGLGILTIAQSGLNLSMLACPLTWIALAIGVIIGFIAKWVQSVGGIQVAWLIVVNALLTAWDWVKIGFFIGTYWVIDLFNKMMLGIRSASVGIQNFIGDMKVGVLTIIQDMVNGAIGLINILISALNNIPGVRINAISEVDFGDTAKLENEAAKKARNAELEDYRKNVESGIAERQVELEKMKTDARNATAKREVGINAAKAEAEARKKASGKYNAEKYNDTGNSAASSANDYAATQNLQNNVANTAANTGEMKNSMDVSEEDLKYMRDIAEQEVINRFTTSEIKVDMTNNNNINSNLDLDGVVSYMEQKVYETISVAAEGGHY